MRSTSAAILFLLTCSVGSSVVAAEAESVVEALKNCARTENPEARFKCYDKLGQQVLSSETQSSIRSDIAEPAVAAVTPEAAPAVAAQVPAGSSVSAAAASAPAAAAASAPAAAAASAPAAATAVQESSSVDASDSIGGYQFQPKLSAEEEIEKQVEEGLRTRVVKCQKNREGTWYFKLENGQVWKQTDRQSLFFRDCDFGAVVANDGLGYVLRIDGRKGKIRIKRRQ